MDDGIAVSTHGNAAALHVALERFRARFGPGDESWALEYERTRALIADWSSPWDEEPSSDERG